MQKPAHIVVLGAGFAGLEFCQRFTHASARVTLVDRSNHHLFQPLLYQVATAGLSAPDIAQPIRSILSNRRNVTVLMESVVDFNLAEKKVMLSSGEMSYDYLVLALGSRTSYFGHPEWERHAPGLKTLADAMAIRRQILLAFEKAETETSAEEQARLMTMVVVGGGPTGVELAGAFSELARHVLRKDFRHIDPAKARVILIEGGTRILAHLAPELSASAQRQLEAMGVHVRLQATVKRIDSGLVELENGETIRAAAIIWAAGVAATPLAEKLGLPLDRGGRVKVNSDLSVPGHAEVFAVGDMALALSADGKPVPGVSPAAMQMARQVARIIEGELSSPGAAARPPFRYWDKGNMATIGRSAAVAQVGSIKLSGLLAWLAWLMIHLIFLVGFRNKISVLFQWFYSYATYKRGARIVIGGKE
ncbi:MAG TPA: NAD(P)/FAD-dependent oxidoreductase [Verrucomicrobiae bacterium]|jgi:NADH dehydrogenase